MHHTIQKKKKMAGANLAARADPKSGFSFFFLGHAACLVYTAALDRPSSPLAPRPPHPRGSNPPRRVALILLQGPASANVSRDPSPEGVLKADLPALSPPPSALSPQHSAFNSALSSQPSAPSPQRRALIGLSPSSYPPRPSALSPEISAFNHHACTLGSPPWGGRASKYRLRARGGNFLFFILLAMIWHTIAKKTCVLKRIP